MTKTQIENELRKKTGFRFYHDRGENTEQRKYYSPHR